MDVTSQDRCIQANQAEFQDLYQTLRWTTDQEARQAAQKRQELLSGLDGVLRTTAKGSKPHFGALAPGCTLCVQGLWSCLFVNGKCNCRCFYCPAEQSQIDVPMTNRLHFPRVDEYLNYLERLEYRGVGLSGGEPLLTFETTLEFTEAIKKRFGSLIHVWLYTNGVLSDSEKLRQLREAGLDEIRFDIGATDYAIDQVRAAAAIIKTVVVEIPAIPEDVPRLKKLLPVLQEVGVKHLNLHQLRVTLYNATKLAQRGYSFLHGEKVTVLESELAALELLRYSAEQVGLPVNYCSFVYRNRFQTAGARRRSARLVLKTYEALTEAGLIRSLSLADPEGSLVEEVSRLRAAGVSSDLWSLGNSGRELSLHPELWDRIDFTGRRLKVVYQIPRIEPFLSYRHPFRELRLHSGRSLFVERLRTSAPLELEDGEIEIFRDRFLKGDERVQIPVSEKWIQVHFSEEIPQGLQVYY